MRILYDKIFKRLHILQGKNIQFINWIYPFLLNKQVQQDDYLYIKNEEIESIYILYKGAAGFVLLLPSNVIYVTVQEGNHIG